MNATSKKCKIRPGRVPDKQAQEEMIKKTKEIEEKCIA